MFRRPAMVLFLVLGLMMTAPALPQVMTAEVEVQGMACPFCVAGVEKHLGEVAGVGSVEIQLDKGLAVLQARAGASIDVERIDEAVRSAGFTPGRVVVEAAGLLRRGETEGEPDWSLATGGVELALFDLEDDLSEAAADLARREVAVHVRGVLRQPVEERAELDAVEWLDATP